MPIDPLVLVLSKNNTETFVPVVAKILLGMDTTPRSILSVPPFHGFSFDPALGSKESCRYHDGGFALRRKRKDNVLDKEQVNGHLVFTFIHNFRNAGKKALEVLLGIQIVSKSLKSNLKGGLEAM